MKKTAFAIAAATIFAAGAVFSACENAGESQLLGEPAKPQTFTYEESRTQGFNSLNAAAGDFAADFAAEAYASYSGKENFAVSPVSVFSALALAAECAEGDTLTEILKALGTDYGTLSENYLSLYRSVQYESKTALSAMSNSVWIDSGVQADSAQIADLADNYGCYSYSADFSGNNKNANLAVKNFIKEQTRGLIDKDVNLGEDTLFTLINTLYLKDNWNLFGDELKLTEKTYNFAQSDGSVKDTKLMQSYYQTIRAFDGENFTSCYAETYAGYKLTFIVPDEGHTLKEVFTAENISAAMNADYSGTDHEAKIHYHTRCLFPAFTAGYDGDVKDTLRGLGINSLFEEYACDLSKLVPSGAKGGIYCPEVRHVTTLTVDRRGIEGAALTIIPGATSPGPDGYENVYLDFVIDRAFGYVVTNSYGTALFSGTVGNI